MTFGAGLPPFSRSRSRSPPPPFQVVLHAVDTMTRMQLHGQANRCFGFPAFCGETGTSRVIFDKHVGKLVARTFEGKNATVLAYGQTGSGKTHTLSGGAEDRGLVGLACEEVFRLAEVLEGGFGPGESLEISASAVEIYNEEFRDLGLGFGGTGAPGPSGRGSIAIRETRGAGGELTTEISGLHLERVRSVDELVNFLERAAEGRTTGMTMLNETSSRSHAIYTVHIVQRRVDELPPPRAGRDGGRVRQTETVRSKLHLVDLAGSERVKRSGVTGAQLKETSSINSGLLALSNVICAVAGEAGGAGGARHIPYRESKLTRVLQDALGGNSYTLLIACVSPADIDFEETSNTLKYANRASKIKNLPVFNRSLATTHDGLDLPAGVQAGAPSYEALIQGLEYHLTRSRSRENAEKRPVTPSSVRQRGFEYDTARRKGLAGKFSDAVDPSSPGPRGGAQFGYEGGIREGRTHGSLPLADMGNWRSPWEGAVQGKDALGAVEGRALGTAGAPRGGEAAAAISATGAGADEQATARPLLPPVHILEGGRCISISAAEKMSDFREVGRMLGTDAETPRGQMHYLLARVRDTRCPVGCLMSTTGTAMIPNCIFTYDEPPELQRFSRKERTELWGLQIPRIGEGMPDRLHLSLGLLFAHCRSAQARGLKLCFCVPRPQLLSKWSKVGLPIRAVRGPLTLIYPEDAHDYNYYRSSTVAYFLVDELSRALLKNPLLSLCEDL